MTTYCSFNWPPVELASNHPERTCELWRGLLARGFHNGSVRYNLAYALGLCGNAEEGVGILDVRWADVCHEIPDTPLLKSKLQHHHGDAKGAIATLGNYLETAPADAEGNGYLA